MANSLPSNGKNFPRDPSTANEDAPGERSPLERLASFRFTYLSIFIFLAAYALTMEAFEGLMNQHFEVALQAAADLDPAEGPVIPRLQDEIDGVLRNSRWIRVGGVRVQVIAVGADEQTLLYAGVRPVALPAAIGELPDATLLPVTTDIGVTVPLSSVAANAILVVYASLLVTILLIYTRTLTRREEIRLGEVTAARDAVAGRAREIETELETVRERLARIEPEQEVSAEEIRALEQERSRLTAKLAGLEQREEKLRSRSSRIQGLEEERRTLEEFLDEAVRELGQKDDEIQSLEMRMKKARTSSRARESVREAEALARRLRTLYKNLEFDDRAVADLVRYGDEALKLKAEEALKRLSDEAVNVAIRRKVGGLPPHLSIFELGFGGKGRAYYTKGRSRRHRILAMGAKNTQKTDLEYLSRLPRE
jgi:predicted nuclease with TOPRIM domain